MVAMAAVYPSIAFAYIGPGAGLSMVGSLLALLGAILLAIFGFVFYPIRRLLKRRKERSTKRDSKPSADEPSSNTGKDGQDPEAPDRDGRPG
jgi:hypothetical protein